MFLGDDFHHNGAFRLSYGFEYAAVLETSKTNKHFAFDTHDTYEWYLDSARSRTPTRNTFTATCPRGTTSSTIPTTTSSGRGRRLPHYLNEDHGP